MHLVVVGMGYVGIPVSVLFASKPGIKVTGIQRRSKRSGWKIDFINKGKSPVGGNEPGLDQLLFDTVKKGAFFVTDDITTYENADAIIIAVQTPVDENHQPRYESLKQVLTDIGQQMQPGTLVCLESTVAPGTTDNVAKPILERESGLKAGTDFNLVFSYERVMVGRLLHNLTYYSRIVGGLTTECAQRGIEFYKNIVSAPLFATDTLTAEISKVVENTYRDVNIAFANEVALICESLGVNVHDVKRFVNSLPNDTSNPDANPYRNMHTPGAGVGGHCLPKDPWLLKYGLDTYGKIKFNPEIIVKSRLLNDSMPGHMKTLLLDAFAERNMALSESKVTLMGFAFLENSDDYRNTPALPLFNLLKGECKQIVIHDTHIVEYEDLPITQDLVEALRDSDCLIVVTKHNEYRELSFDLLRKYMRTPVIIDGRNVFNRQEALTNGFTFRGVGLPR